MTGERKSMNRVAPLLWAAAGVMFGVAAWLSQQISFAGVGVMFLLLGLAAWLKNRKAERA